MFDNMYLYVRLCVMSVHMHQFYVLQIIFQNLRLVFSRWIPLERIHCFVFEKQ